MKKISFLLIFSILFFSCSLRTPLTKSKDKWIIPQDEDIRITLKDSIVVIFEKGEFVYFDDKYVLKGIGIKENDKSISKLVIPLKDVEKVEILNNRVLNATIATSAIAGIGVIVYFMLKKDKE